MPNQIRTVDFLPEIFRTDTNSQFLNATLDVLVKQPDFKRIEGYIGEKYGYGVRSDDHYVVESDVNNGVRRKYQLNPSVVSLKPGTDKVKDIITYPGIIDALRLNGADVSRHDRLFNSETSSWDPFVDLDKIVNYGQYYWVPYGPDALEINSGTVTLNADFKINDSVNGIKVDSIDAFNVTINLVRGGSYTFDSNNPFYLQTSSNFSTDPTTLDKNVLGVTDNGTNLVTFNVPTIEELNVYDLPDTQFVDLVSELSVIDIDGQNIFDLGGIDGVTGVNGRSLLINDGTPQESFYTIALDGVGRITLIRLIDPIIEDEAINVRSGTKYVGARLFRNASGDIQLIPSFSNRMYYRSAMYPNNVGIINLVEPAGADTLSVDTDILGAKTYTSANGVKFTNGLKITFKENVSPVEYANNSYYVEGVGSAITLWNVKEYIAPELSDNIQYNPWSANPWESDHWDADYYVPVKPDYITISRDDSSYNAWTRSNRWFHQSVIDETIKHLGVVSRRYNNTTTRALRPIIEFDGNISLFNHGTTTVGPITTFDTVETDCLTNIVGRPVEQGYVIDGYRLNSKDRVVFANDASPLTRKSVFVVDFVEVNGVQVINLTADPNLIVSDNDSVLVLTGETVGGSTYTYAAGVWSLSQRKRTSNQPPLFNVYNTSGISFSDTDYYNNSTFSGSKLFSYSLGTGANDPVLGFPIKYSSISNVGDINFTIDYNNDTFTYSDYDAEVTANINTGYVHIQGENDYSVKNGWVPRVNQTVQHQIFQYDVVDSTTSFTLDVPVKQNYSESTIEVYVGSTLLQASDYTVVVQDGKTIITLTSPVTNTGVTILALSDVASSSGYYEYPSNLTNNPFNSNVTSLDVGDIRNQYNSIFKSTATITGSVYGYNNYHDSGNLLGYGSSIVKNSASLVLPGIFLRNKEFDLFDALEFNSREYINYKSLLIELAQATDYSVYQTPSDILDDVINKIGGIRSGSASFYYSDMLPTGSPYTTHTFNFRNNINDVVVDLTKFYDFSSANYDGIGVYLTREINGVPTSIQLIRNVDYLVSTTNATLNVTKELFIGDVLTVKEFNQTYGSYCPNTPTKLGLYPSFKPEIVLDTTAINPTYFIRGHDGSYTKLFGTYVDGVLDDFRDVVLLEFEQRVYNNLKVSLNSQSIPLTIHDVMSGQFRTADYSWEEIQNIYSTQFLNWVGANRVQYIPQQFMIDEERTYNYNQSTDRIKRQQIKQGGWRGIYRYFYDTENPAEMPWQMLGFSDKPDYWDSRYGVAPYTSDNSLMWEEISNGYVHGVGVVSKYVRPSLLNVLPVDGRGSLVDPMTSVVANYSRLSFNRDWTVGDVGPVEASYLRSSSWPFDAMRILALTKPAKFFNLFADIDRYKYNTTLNQYLYDNGGYLDPRNLEIYGSGVSKHSYINWIIDYVAVRGVAGTDLITSLLSNTDVRLSYSLGGFSSKEYLKFYIERTSPDSNNRGLLIPDESYTVLLYDNVPVSTITYSSVLVQKTKDGYKVWGNSQNKLYFTTVTPKSGRYRKVTVGKTTVQLSAEYYDDRLITIPYGTEFYSVQSLCEFIMNYGRYLETQGVRFENTRNGFAIDWQRMVSEAIYWDQQSWDINSTISLNPNATSFVVDKDGYVVQPLTIQERNFILNQQLLPLQNQNVSIVRDNNKFTANVTSSGDSIAFSQLNLHNIEHVVVFDNITVFNDVIYNLGSGLRQTRLIIRGSKTNNYRGYVDASGFILNEDNIQEWNNGTKYTRGSIVAHKNNYYTASTVIQPSENFDIKLWQQINYDAIKTGLLPNPSTVAYDSLYYYDSYRANLKLDSDLLSFSLIGYRPRNYLAYSDLSDITQINVYKTIIREKGTSIAIDGFKNLKFEQGSLDYNVLENWAIQGGEFGHSGSSNFVEFELNQPNLNSNPSVVAFIDDANTDVNYSNEIIHIGSAINWATKPLTRDFLPLYKNKTSNIGNNMMLPSAGHVHKDDVDFTAYTYENLKFDTNNYNNLMRGDYIWIPNDDSTWNVLSPVSVGTVVVKLTNSQVGQLMFTFEEPHNLAVGDKFVILQFNENIDGYYIVDNVRTRTEVIVGVTNINNIGNAGFNLVTLTGKGVVFKLNSARVEQPSDIVNETRGRFWVDTDKDGQWAVYEPADAYVAQSKPGGIVGTTGAYGSTVGYLVGDPTNSTVYAYTEEVSSSFQSGYTNFGKVIKIVDNRAYILSDNAVTIYDSRLEPIQDIAADNPEDITISNDRRWMYLSKPSGNIIYIFKMNTNGLYSFVSSLTGTDTTVTGFGTSISTTLDGSKLVIGSPYEDINVDSGIIERAGRAYIYSRFQQSFESTDQFAFFLSRNPDDVDVYINDVLVTTGEYTLYGTELSFSYYIPAGSTVTVEGSVMTLSSVLQSEVPHEGALFGLSVATNRYGAEIIVGSPYDLSNDIATQNVTGEGAVYRYTNIGQRYGTVVMNNPAPVSGDSMFVNGFNVVFTAGTLSDYALQINEQTGDNVIATANESSNTIVIDTRNDASDVVNDVLDIVGNMEVLDRLGIVVYDLSQIIYNPNVEQNTAFGASVSMSSSDALVIGAPNSVDIVEMTFDGTATSHNDYTVFDHGATQFVDGYERSGAAYLYDYLPSYLGSVDNHGQYVYGQSLSYPGNRDFIQDYGSRVYHCDGAIIVSHRDDIIVHKLNSGYSSWSVTRKPLPAVDINQLHGINIYDTDDNSTLSYLDYIDSNQGKLLGVVSENLDYATDVDPAGYIGDNVGNKINNVSGTTWLEDQVGRTWLDTRTVRMLNAHQTDVKYNSENWSSAHIGSTAVVYCWTESLFKPVNFVGSGFPFDYNTYNTATKYDARSNNIVTVYYYWVGNSDIVPGNKKLSPNSISQYILNPRNSGISFIAPITTNIVALYNTSDSIKNSGSALHIGYGETENSDSIHTSWSLIRDGESADFLSGFPNSGSGSDPAGLYLKLLDSLCGVDGLGLPVPDSTLPELVQFGTKFRPRQTMFLDRLAGIQNIVQYANNVMIDLPLSEIRSLSGLTNATNSGLVSRANYWVSGYSDATKPRLEVATYSDLMRIQQDQLEVGTESNLFLENGTIVRVANNSAGQSETYVFNGTGWDRIGLTKGTIRINNSMYSSTTNSATVREVLRWIFEICYSDELQIHRNATLMMLFRLIQSGSPQGNNYLPWLTKTSLINVNYRIRELLPYSKLQRDNTELLTGYINEVKPYHVYVSDLVFSYGARDDLNGDVTDFDLPAQYNTTTGRFESPRLVYASSYDPIDVLPSDSVWSNSEYTKWFNHYGLRADIDNISEQITATLAEDIGPGDSVIPVSDTEALAEVGTVTIDNETMTYSGIDRLRNKLTGVYRGATEAGASAHQAGAKIYSAKQTVIVVDTGRDYTLEPRITVEYNIDSPPRRVMSLRPIMSLGKVVGISVTDAGDGYPSQPRLHVEPSLIESFIAANVDVDTNYITIMSHALSTGDSVRYIGETVAGMIDGEYYYVRTVDANTIALYSRYGDAVEHRKLDEYDAARVTLSDGTLIAAGTLGVAARAILNVDPNPVRNFKVTLLFDRVTYRPSAVPTDDNAIDRITQYYNPTVNMPDTLPQLMTGITYPNVVTQGPAFNLGAGWDLYSYSEVPWDVGGNISQFLDTIIESPDFVGLTDNPGTNHYDVEGGKFTDGYGPEELIPGIVTDSLEVLVMSEDFGSAAPSVDPSFRISVDRAGVSRIFNINLNRRTTLSQDWTGGDTIYITNADRLVQILNVNTTVSTDGRVKLTGIDTNRITRVEVRQSGTVFNATWINDQRNTGTGVGEMHLQLEPGYIAGDNAEVRLYIGNLIYLNGEYIGFERIDPVTDSISGLHRGRLNTFTNPISPDNVILADSVVYAVRDVDQLANEYYTDWWFETFTTGFEQAPYADQFDEGGWEDGYYEDVQLKDSVNIVARILQNNTVI